MKITSSQFLKSKKILFIAIPLVIIILFVFVFKSSGNSLETAMAEVGSVTEKVVVTGKVIAVQRAEMGFENGGVVSAINHKVGDMVKMGDVIITLDSINAYAQLSAEKARLAELEKGLRVEELTVEQSKLNSAQTDLEDARTGIITAFHDAYIKSEGAIYNYADSLFTNPQTIVPLLKVRTDSYIQKNTIEAGRVSVGDKLRAWKSDIDSIGLSTSTNPSQYINNAKIYVETVKGFMSQLSTIISNLSTGNSGLTQSQIDAYNLSINTAMSNFNSGVSSLATADANYRSSLSNYNLSQNQYTLKKAGSSIESIEVQAAKVQQAEAEVAKKRIVSPIDGVVTKIAPQLGEFVSVGQVAATVMTDTFKIEVNIPETDIVKIALDNKAVINLDAYDDSISFNAHVTAIDPAETIVEGVPTYKVTLQFDDKDARIRSGMTANINIVTQNRDGVVTVPFRSVLEKNGQKYVRVVSGETYTEVPVTTGVRGNDGKIEIVTGINAGEKIVTFVK
jgi:RND family efflux transporter MFP subunit